MKKTLLCKLGFHKWQLIRFRIKGIAWLVWRSINLIKL